MPTTFISRELLAVEKFVNFGDEYEPEKQILTLVKIKTTYKMYLVLNVLQVFKSL